MNWSIPYPVHNFIVLGSKRAAFLFGSSSQLYFANEEKLGRRINDLEALQFTTLLFVDTNLRTTLNACAGLTFRSGVLLLLFAV